MSLNHIRRHAPLVHCISNIVVANFKANGLLAIGASPVMADAPEEVAQMVAIAGVLSINMGTLNSESVKAMLAAGRTANALNKPVVFDPVGAGATEFRRHTVRDIMREVKLNVLRCNVGELAAVAEVPWQQKGVDSGEGDLAIVEVAKQVAKQYHTVVAVTGGGQVHSAQLVQKVHPHHLMAFAAGEEGPLAWVEDGGVRLRVDWFSGRVEQEAIEP